jgi:hypothetical protein
LSAFTVGIGKKFTSIYVGNGHEDSDPPARERHLSRRAAVDFLEQLSQNSLASCIIACYS